jgi:hypothetical protein
VKPAISPLATSRSMRLRTVARASFSFAARSEIDARPSRLSAAIRRMSISSSVGMLSCRSGQ